MLHTNMSPSVYMKEILSDLVECKNNKSSVQQQQQQRRFSLTTSTNATRSVAPTDEQLNAYDVEIVRAIRNNDLITLQELYENGHSFDACNRNGETLLHLACRRCTYETIQYLLEIVRVPCNVTDGLGRSIVHDVCWRPRMDTDIMELLMKHVHPSLFIQCDQRGHGCFDYCRKEHWKEWNTFLMNHRTQFEQRSKLCTMFDKVIMTAESS